MENLQVRSDYNPATANNGTPIILAQNITKEYGTKASRVQILKGVNFRVDPGEMVAIVGASGSGKTTMLGIIGGLDVPTSGNISLAGQEISKMSEKQLARVRNRTIGFVFQFFNLVSTLTALENVMLPIQFDRKARFSPEKRAKELLDLVGLSHRLNNRPNQLSGGEQQRVAVARALANQPQLLLGDEPTGNLNSALSNEILALLQKLRKELGLTVVLVTHDENVARACDRRVTMVDGMLYDGAR